MADKDFVVKNGLVVNTTFSANSSGIYFSNTLLANSTTINITTINATTLIGTANNASYLGGTAASGYQTTSGLSSNVATLTANNTSFVGSVSAANVVSNAQLSANLSNYQTTAGLNANIASYLPTYTGVVNGSSHAVGSSFIANSVGITTTGYANIGGTATASAIIDAKGNVRSVPQNAQTSAYVLVANDAGKHISITTGGVTVPASVFSVGDTIVIYNNSSSSQVITQGSGANLILVASGSTGNRTLSAYGLSTTLCIAANTFIISGVGLS